MSRAKILFVLLCLLLATGCPAYGATPSPNPRGFCPRHPSNPNCVSPTPTPSDPTQTPTEPTSSPPQPGNWTCTPPVGYGATCGAYAYAGIVNSNGYNTYVGVDCWANPQC